VPPPVLDPDLVQRGALLFHDPRLSADGARSCASCHPGGGTDRRAYDASGREVRPGSAGARDVPSLQGAWRTPPFLRDGSAQTLGDAIARMQAYLGGRPLGAPERAALEAYASAIPSVERGRIGEDGAPLEPSTLRMRRGFEVFQRLCANCHPPPLFSDRRTHDVGTGGALDTPGLRGVADSAPYGHDGRFPALADAIRAKALAEERALADRELENLIEYLKLL
jgi:cytochrome c peroxidase